jgi:Xaa-Pro aminopeptidase
LLVVPATFPNRNGGGGENAGEGARKWLKFEYVTKVPMCLELVESEMLSAAERQWVDAYHATVLRELEPRLVAAVEEEEDEGTGSTSAVDTLAWLRRSARPVGQS